MKTHKKMTFAFAKTKNAALITAVLIAALLCTACSGGTKAFTVTDGASLILNPDNLTITVEAITADGSAVAVEGCTETTLASGTETTLHAQDTAVILKGKITELYCGGNRLTALNVQGLSTLQELRCYDNQLTALNVQGLSALQELRCGGNQLTALNVQGLSALQWLYCSGNQLTSLSVQGLNALQWLECDNNQLAFLNVQGLNALQVLDCSGNQLTSLNVQGLSDLFWLDCSGNQLNVQALTSLLTGLPARSPSDGAKCTLYAEDSEEGNHTDFTAPAELYTAFQNAKTKNWKLHKEDSDTNYVEL